MRGKGGREWGKEKCLRERDHFTEIWIFNIKCWGAFKSNYRNQAVSRRMRVLVTDMSICCFILALLNVNNGTIDPGPKAGLCARPIGAKRALFQKTNRNALLTHFFAKSGEQSWLQSAGGVWTHRSRTFDFFRSLIMLPPPFFRGKRKTFSNRLYHFSLVFLTKCFWRSCRSHSEK